MPRCIDADALSYRLEKRIDGATDFSFAEGLSEAIVEVGLSPTLSPDDVRPVGKWVKNHHPKCIFSELIWIGGYRSEVEACEAWNWRYDYV